MYFFFLFFFFFLTIRATGSIYYYCFWGGLCTLKKKKKLFFILPHNTAPTGNQNHYESSVLCMKLFFNNFFFFRFTPAVYNNEPPRSHTYYIIIILNGFKFEYYRVFFVFFFPIRLDTIFLFFFLMNIISRDITGRPYTVIIRIGEQRSSAIHRLPHKLLKVKNWKKKKTTVFLHAYPRDTIDLLIHTRARAP